MGQIRIFFMEFSPRIFDTVMAISARLCCCPITRREIKIRPRFTTFRQLVSLVWRRAAFIFAILSQAWLRYVVQVSGPGAVPTLARRGRHPGRGGGRGRGPGEGDYLHTSDIINGGSPLAAQLPAMSPGQPLCWQHRYCFGCD